MNRLRKLRKENNLTLKSLSKKLKKRGLLNISPDSLAKYERGDREPKIKKWEALAKFFDVSVPYLQGISPAKKSIQKPCDFCNLVRTDYSGMWQAKRMHADDDYVKTGTGIINVIEKQPDKKKGTVYCLAFEKRQSPGKIIKKYGAIEISNCPWCGRKLGVSEDE